MEEADAMLEAALAYCNETFTYNSPDWHTCSSDAFSEWNAQMSHAAVCETSFDCSVASYNSPIWEFMCS